LMQKTKNMIPADDEDIAFFVSLLLHLKKMDSQTKLLCRIDIQRSVFYYAYNMEQSFQFQNVQSQRSYISLPSPTVLDSSSIQFSDNASSPQESIQSGNIITFTN